MPSMRRTRWSLEIYIYVTRIALPTLVEPDDQYSLSDIFRYQVDRTSKDRY